jgi:hypothetical protein
MYSSRRLFERLKDCPEDYGKLYSVLQRKIKVIQEKIGIYQYYIPSPSNTEEKMPIPNLECLIQDILFKPSYEIIFSLKKKRDIIFNKEKSEFLYTYRKKNKLLIDNPYSGKVQSWNSPQLANTNKHVSKIPGASKITANRERVEFAAFNEGVGYIYPGSPTNRLYLFCQFSEVIGISNGEDSRVLKLHVDRRKSGRGYFSEIHGYPVGKQDLARIPKPVRDKLL